MRRVDRSIELIGVAHRPGERCVPAQRSANDRSQTVDTQMGNQFPLNLDDVAVITGKSAP